MTHLTDQQVREERVEFEKWSKYYDEDVDLLRGPTGRYEDSNVNGLWTCWLHRAADLQEARVNAKMQGEHRHACIKLINWLREQGHDALIDAAAKAVNSKGEAYTCAAEAERDKLQAALSEANAKVEQLVGDLHAAAQDYTNEHKECERLRRLLSKAEILFGMAGAGGPWTKMAGEIRSALSTEDATKSSNTK